MSDDKPTPEPQYGVYATPEEQRRRMGLPPESAPVPIPVEGQSGTQPRQPADGAPGRAPIERSSSGPGSEAPGRSATAPGLSPAFNWNRAFTFLFLGVGLYTVLTSVPGMLGLHSTLVTVSEQLGIEDGGGLVNSPALQAFGFAAAAVYIIGWVLALWLSLRSLRAGRLSWWIPVVIGLLVTVVGMALTMGALLSQPEFMNSLMQSSLSGGFGAPTQTPTP